MTNDKAQRAFMARKTHVDSLIATLQAASDDNFYTDPDAITWGHVGDLDRMAARLLEALGGIEGGAE